MRAEDMGRRERPVIRRGRDGIHLAVRTYMMIHGYPNCAPGLPCGCRPTTQLTDIARECRRIYDAAVADLGSDLGGHSVLDLMADNLDYPLRTLADAIVVAGIPISNETLRRVR